MAVTTAAVVGIAGAVAGTGMSFAQASKAKKERNAAAEAAQAAMADARKRLEINVFEGLSVKKLPYEQAREASLVQGAMATEAARESERGVAATAGRVQMAQQEQQAKIAAAQEAEMTEIERLAASEEGRLLDVGTQLDLEEVAGAQQAAMEAQERMSQATQRGMEGIVNLTGQIAAAAPLFAKTSAARQVQKLQREAAAGKIKPEDLQNKLAGMGSYSGIDLSGVGYTTNMNYKEDEIKRLMSADNTLTKEQAAAQVKMKMTQPQFADYLSQFEAKDLRSLRKYLFTE